ncbi:mevalonate kinase [Candidatus Daviesbacteria bacterium]|nr:mevalonate kinase [Candidatus Daviesbacteria bacterium]
MRNNITVSAPGKIHLLGEHMVVYGKPALLATVNLRVVVTLSEAKGIYSSGLMDHQNDNIKKIIESIVKKELKVKFIPPYQLEISSQLPIGAGLGSSAAVSAAVIGALLTFLKIKFDLTLVNKLTFEAEKVFHGNPSGGDNSTVVFGGLVWFRKEHPDLKIIQPVPFSIPKKLAKNFVLINTGKPQETTREMVELVESRVSKACDLTIFKSQESSMKKVFDHQEQLVRELLPAVQTGNEKELMRIIKEGEQNLEKIGVVSLYVKKIIRQIEKAGGVAKICGAGGQTKATGILLCYHPTPSVVNNIAKSFNLDYFKTALGVEGLKDES